MHENCHSLLDFYLERGEDHRGRSLSGILGYSNQWLEREHDYIQWLFPTGEGSPYCTAAPVVDPDVIDAFAHNSLLRANQQLAFQRMMEFYGFEVDDDVDDNGKATVYIDRSSDFERHSQQWLKPGNHNFKRITRIGKSTFLLSSPHLAIGLGNALDMLGRDFGGLIGSKTLSIWKSVFFGPSGKSTKTQKKMS